MRLASSPTGSIFDQRAHICAEVFVIKFSLSAILLFEREEYLLLYESLWLYVYTLLTFYSVEKPFRTRILAKLETSILHENIKILFFLLSFGKCPEASRRHPRHLRMRLDCLLDPSGPPETHQSPKWKFSFFHPPTDPLVTFSRCHFPSKARPQRTAVGGKQRFQYIHLAEIPNWYHMRLVSSPNGSIFDQRAHICAEVFDTKFSLSAILLFEREVNLLLYESLWLYVYTILTFYSVKKLTRTRF